MKKKQIHTVLLSSFILISLLFSSCEKTEPNDDRATSKDAIIGRGYDITGRYAYSPEIKEPVLDFDKLDKAGMVMEDKNLAESNFLTRSGSTITEYQSKLAVSASASASGSVPGASFSAEVGANFDKEKYESNEYAFATSSSKITKSSFYLESRRYPSELIEYLTDNFTSELETLSGEELIEKYGTDVMLGAIFGARLDYHLTAKKTTTSSGTAIGAYAQAKVEATYGSVGAEVGTSASVDTEFSDFFETTSVVTTTNAYGGASEYARSVHDKGDYDKWIETIEDNPIWCDYYPESLQPLYKFISDTNSSTYKKVYDAYYEYLEGKVITVTSTEEIDTVTNSFEVKGGASKIGGDDADINSTDGSETEYEFTITISKSGSTNLQAEISYRAKEMTSNYTELLISKVVTIPVNKNISTIDINPTSYTKQGTISNENHGWIYLSEDCSWLKSVYIAIDGDGDDDKNIGIKGNFIIPIHYKP